MASGGLFSGLSVNTNADPTAKRKSIFDASTSRSEAQANPSLFTNTTTAQSSSAPLLFGNMSASTAAPPSFGKPATTPSSSSSGLQPQPQHQAVVCLEMLQHLHQAEGCLAPRPQMLLQVVASSALVRQLHHPEVSSAQNQGPLHLPMRSRDQLYSEQVKPLPQSNLIHQYSELPNSPRNSLSRVRSKRSLRSPLQETAATSAACWNDKRRRLACCLRNRMAERVNYQR